MVVFRFRGLQLTKRTDYFLRINLFNSVLAKLDELSLVADQVFEFDPRENTAEDELEVLRNALYLTVGLGQLACVGQVQHVEKGLQGSNNRAS